MNQHNGKQCLQVRSGLSNVGSAQYPVTFWNDDPGAAHKYFRDAFDRGHQVELVVEGQPFNPPEGILVVSLDSQHRTPLFIACEKGYAEVVDIMLTNTNWNELKRFDQPSPNSLKSRVELNSTRDFVSLLDAALQRLCQKGHEATVRLFSRCLFEHFGPAAISRETQQAILESSRDSRFPDHVFRGWFSPFSFSLDDDVCEVCAAIRNFSDRLTVLDNFNQCKCSTTACPGHLTPLHWACEVRRGRVVSDLLAALRDTVSSGIDGSAGSDSLSDEVIQYVNAKSTEGVTALHIASHQGAAHIIEQLLVYKANANVVIHFEDRRVTGPKPQKWSEWQHWPLATAPPRKSPPCVTAPTVEVNLSASSDDDDNDDEEVAASSSDEQTHVVNDSPCIFDINRTRTTALDLAVSSGNSNAVAVLTKYGAKRYAELEQEFIDACSTGFISGIRDGIEMGVDVDCLSDDGVPALHLACRSRCVDGVALLLDNRADINVCDHVTGNTALHMLATISDSLEMVRLLLSRNARMLDLNDHGQTPLNLACALRNSEFVHAMLRHAALHHIPNKLERVVNADIGTSHQQPALTQVIKDCNKLAVTLSPKDVTRLESELHDRGDVGKAIFDFLDGEIRVTFTWNPQQGDEEASEVSSLRLDKGENENESYPLTVKLSIAAESFNQGIVDADMEQKGDWFVVNGAFAAVKFGSFHFSIGDRIQPIEIVGTEQDSSSIEIHYHTLRRRLDISVKDLRVAIEASENDDKDNQIISLHSGIYLVNLLLENGADVYQSGGDGMTALHWACRKGDHESIKAILIHMLRCGDTSSVWTHLVDAADTARLAKHDDIADFLLQLRTKSSVDAVAFLQSNGWDIEASDVDERYSLIWSCYYRNATRVKGILKLRVGMPVKRLADNKSGKILGAILLDSSGAHESSDFYESSFVQPRTKEAGMEAAARRRTEAEAAARRRMEAAEALQQQKWTEFIRKHYPAEKNVSRGYVQPRVDVPIHKKRKTKQRKTLPKRTKKWNGDPHAPGIFFQVEWDGESLRSLRCDEQKRADFVRFKNFKMK